MARLATILSFSDHVDAAPRPDEEDHHQHDDDDEDAESDASDDSFEFAFARPLAPEHDAADALADDLFAHGRIVPAYPVFHRLHNGGPSSASSATAPPSPDTYCAWTPRSAPGSPARETAAFPKSASTGHVVPRFRLRDLVGSGAGRRSHSDGKEKFLFFQPTPKPKATAPAASVSSPAVTAEKRAAKKQQAKPKQGTKKGAAAVTEMDMATAHRLFYSKPGANAAAGERTSTTTTTTKSYLPYRPAIVGFFAAAHGLRPKHHPY